MAGVERGRQPSPRLCSARRARARAGAPARLLGGARCGHSTGGCGCGAAVRRRERLPRARDAGAVVVREQCGEAGAGRAGGGAFRRGLHRPQLQCSASPRLTGQGARLSRFRLCADGQERWLAVVPAPHRRPRERPHGEAGVESGAADHLLPRRTQRVDFPLTAAGGGDAEAEAGVARVLPQSVRVRGGEAGHTGGGAAPARQRATIRLRRRGQHGGGLDVGAGRRLLRPIGSSGSPASVHGRSGVQCLPQY